MTTVAPMHISDNRVRSRSASIVSSTSASTIATASTLTLISSAWNVSSIKSGSLSASSSPSASSRSLNRIHSHHERTTSSYHHHYHHHGPISEHLEVPSTSHPSHTRSRSQTISPHPAHAVMYHDCSSEPGDDDDDDAEPPASSSRPHPLIRPRSASLRTVAAAPVLTSRHPFTVSPTLPGASWQQDKLLDINKKVEYGHQREKESEEELLPQDPDVPPLML